MWGAERVWEAEWVQRGRWALCTLPLLEHQLWEGVPNLFPKHASPKEHCISGPDPQCANGGFRASTRSQVWLLLRSLDPGAVGLKGYPGAKGRRGNPLR